MEQAPANGGRLVPPLLGLAAFVLYVATLAPGLMWGDSARFCERSILYVPGAEPGEHHLRNWFGRLANTLPWGTIPWRQNLVSAVFGALAVAWLARVGLLVTRSPWGAALAAAALAVSHTHWHLSAFCESYSLLAFLILVATELLLRWQETGDAKWAVRASFVCGLAAADHLFTLVLGPVLVLFLLVGRPRPEVFRGIRWAPLLVLAFALGFLPALIGAVRMHVETERPWEDVFYDLLDLRGRKYFADDVRTIVRFHLRSILFLGFQFPFLAGILGLVGLVATLREGLRRAALPLLVFVMTIAWCGLYQQQRNVYLLLVAWVMFAIWIARGAESLRSWLKAKVKAPFGAVAAAVFLLTVVTPPILYAVTPAIAKRFDISIAGAESLRTFKARPATWILFPWKHREVSADRYASTAFEAAPPRSAIVCDFTPATVLSCHRRLHGSRPDVELVPLERALGSEKDLSAWIEANLDRRPVLLASDDLPYRVDRLADRYHLTPCGPLLRVLRR